jgi:hypothetical protein
MIMENSQIHDPGSVCCSPVGSTSPRGQIHSRVLFFDMPQELAQRDTDQVSAACRDLFN